MGDKILLSTKNLKLKNEERTLAKMKLLPRYIGPYAITARVGKVAYRLALPGHTRIHPVFHVSQLKPYHDHTCHWVNRSRASTPGLAGR